MANTDNRNTQQEPTLYGIQPALELVFPDEATRPSIRLWNEWRAKGFYSYVRIGKRIFIDPERAKRELMKRFEIQAID